MGNSRPLDLVGVLVMLLLCLSWAFQQITVKYALPEIGPLGQGSLRSAGGTLLAGAWILWRLSSTPWMPNMNWRGIVAGILFGAEFILLFVGLVYTDASRSVMFLYTAPFVVAIGCHFLVPGERLDAKSIVGILLAFVGVVTTLELDLTASDTLKGDLMCLAAGTLWGMTTVWIKSTRLRECPPAQVLWYQLAVSAVMFFVAGFLAGDSPFVPMGPVTISAVLYQTVWVTTITFGIWFWLITIYSATTLSVITFVTPIAGAAMGYLLLDDPLGSGFVFSVIAVAVGILLVSLPRSKATTTASRT